MRRFHEIFAIAIELYPPEIDISYSLPGVDDEGRLFVKLSEAHAKAEEAYRHDPGCFESLMIWSIFCVLHDNAMRTYKAGGDLLRPKDISLSEYEGHFWADLHKEDWPELLPEYERS